jgi:hypothetical protein
MLFGNLRTAWRASRETTAFGRVANEYVLRKGDDKGARR